MASQDGAKQGHWPIWGPNESKCLPWPFGGLPWPFGPPVAPVAFWGPPVAFWGPHMALYGASRSLLGAFRGPLWPPIAFSIFAVVRKKKKLVMFAFSSKNNINYVFYVRFAALSDGYVCTHVILAKQIGLLIIREGMVV